MSLEIPEPQPDRLLPEAVEDRLISAFARLAGLMTLAAIVATWLSLLTWSAKDPSFTNATGGAVENFMGYPGAVLSDLLLQSFGVAAVVVLLAPTFWALELAIGQGTRGLRAKLTYYPFAVLVLAGAFSALPIAANWPLHHGFGGILGDAVYRLVAHLLSLVAADSGGSMAGLILFALGFAALTTSIGLEVRDLLAGVKSGVGQRARDLKQSVRLEPMIGAVREAGPKLKSHVDRWRDGAAETPNEPDVVIAETPELNQAGSAQPMPQGPFVGGLADHSPSQSLSPSTAPQRPAPGWGPHIPNHWPTIDALPPPVRPVRSSASAPPVAERSPQSPMRPAAPGPFGFGQAAPAMAVQPFQPMPPSPAVRGPAHRPHPALGSQPIAPPPVPPGVVKPPMPPLEQSAARPAPSEADRHADMPRMFRKAHQAKAELMAQSEDEVHRGEDFDAFTDEASLAMARRFAPATVAASPAGPPVANAMPTTSAPRQAARADTRPAAPQPSRAASPSAKKKLPPLMRGMTFNARQGYQRPSLNLLTSGPVRSGAAGQMAEAGLQANARLLEEVLKDFGVKGNVRGIQPGPVVTLYEFEPARGIKTSRVIGLSDDIARSMSALSARVAVIAGRNLIGIELPNAHRQTVFLRDMIESDAFRKAEGALPIVLGQGIGGEPVVSDLARMPHLLVAGTTGSGKSVGVNAMILSLIYRFGPEQCRLLMIDPKMLELSVYNDIPHLLAPVVTDPMKAVGALNWVVAEMEERYKKMAQLSVRNIDVFNNRVRNAKKRGEMIARTVQTGFDEATGQAVFEQEQLEAEQLPYIVVVIDEFADLMMVAGKEVEGAVQRLAQMARAAGIHLIMSTQRPSVDVITGTIKANFPTRVSFKVASKIDSRTILNEQGAEQLLGRGDMMFAAGGGAAKRVHGPFVADDEVEAIADALRAMGRPDYVELPVLDEAVSSTEGASDGHATELYDDAVALVARERRASTSYLQRRMSIGYNRAADLIDRMEDEGLVSAPDARGKRVVLIGGDQEDANGEGGPSRDEAAA